MLFKVLFILIIGTTLKALQSFDNCIKYYVLLCISPRSKSYLPSKVKHSEMTSNLSKVPQVVGWQGGDSDPADPILKPMCYLPSFGTAFSTMQSWMMTMDSKLQRKAQTG